MRAAPCTIRSVATQEKKRTKKEDSCIRGFPPVASFYIWTAIEDIGNGGERGRSKGRGAAVIRSLPKKGEKQEKRGDQTIPDRAEKKKGGGHKKPPSQPTTPSSLPAALHSIQSPLPFFLSLLSPGGESLYRVREEGGRWWPRRGRIHDNESAAALLPDCGRAPAAEP